MVWIEIIGLVTTVLAVIGTVLNNQRRRACFSIWLVSNASSLGCHVALAAYSFALRDAIFFALAIHGLFAWRRPQKASPQITQMTPIEKERSQKTWDEYETILAADRRNRRRQWVKTGKARFYLHTPSGNSLPSGTMSPAGRHGG
jgi:hypothetical protein